jgi:hypothetical protein
VKRREFITRRVDSSVMAAIFADAYRQAGIYAGRITGPNLRNFR